MSTSSRCQATFAATLLEKVDSFNGLRQFIDEPVFEQLARRASSAESLIAVIAEQVERGALPPWLSELAAMEAHLFALDNRLIAIDPYPDQQLINPGLKIFSNSWKHLVDFCDGRAGKRTPEKGSEQVMAWSAPGAGTLVRLVTDQDLLVLKIAMEQLDPKAVAELAGTSTAVINGALLQALESGILLGPRSRIERSRQAPPNDSPGAEDIIATPFASSRVFALQWHITQACDLNCLHCYDRTPSAPLGLSRELRILDNLAEFCEANRVFGQVSFTGGNPLLHPNFQRLYREASDRGFFIGILGNPASQAEIEPLTAIQPPAFYQMSLEGLEAHNDYIRGAGHFQRVLAFLDILRENDIYSKIMLTLTRDNLDQVIELGKLLQGRTDLFTFNRLSLVGEGANLVMADPEDFRKFLADYLESSREYSVFDLKDNLFNIRLDESGASLFGGCTGYGCGAAFNFVSVLATGEVHACRKFPSPIGDLTRQSLTEIYHTDLARAYRKGPDDCLDCHLNRVCRGCMAASHSRGLDVFSDRDPYCFIPDK